MQFKDLLRAAVLLFAVEATALGGVSVLLIGAAGSDLLATVSFGWWLVALGLGAWLGRAERAARALAGPLAAARTTTTLPQQTPARIALARLWPVIAFVVVAGGLGALYPQVPAIGTGALLLVALAWRRREAVVTAIEERDGVCFFVEYGSAFEPIKLIRTPGLMRGRAASIHPPPPPAG